MDARSLVGSPVGRPEATPQSQRDAGGPKLPPQSSLSPVTSECRPGE